MSLWAADDAKGTLIEPPNQLPISGIVGNCESVFSTFRESTGNDLHTSIISGLQLGRKELLLPTRKRLETSVIENEKLLANNDNKPGIGRPAQATSHGTRTQYT